MTTTIFARFAFEHVSVCLIEFHTRLSRVLIRDGVVVSLNVDVDGRPEDRTCVCKSLANLIAFELCFRIPDFDMMCSFQKASLQRSSIQGTDFLNLEVSMP